MDISIVIPVYQAESSIGKVIDDLQADPYLSKQSWELILVDDVSTDNSFKIIHEKAKQYNNILGLSLHKNVGQHSATFAGIQEASGDLLITMDDDGEHPIQQIPEMIRFAREQMVDVVFGVPEESGKNKFRKLVSYLFKKATQWFSDSYGDGSSFRLIQKPIYDQLKKHTLPFVFIDEILAWYTKKVVFHTMVFHPSPKASTYRSKRLFWLFSNIMFTYSSFPAQLLTKLGIGGSIVSFLIGIFYIIKKLFFKAQLGFTSIAVSILFSASIILLGLGIIAQYIFRQNRLLNQFPQYSIRQRTNDE